MCVLSGCSSQPALATPTDPYSAVAQQADAAYAQGNALYEQGRFREALDAFERARLLSPVADPRIEEMIQRTRVEVTPTARPVSATVTARATPAATATATASGTPGATATVGAVGASGVPMAAGAMPTPVPVPAAAAAPPAAPPTAVPVSPAAVVPTPVAAEAMGAPAAPSTVVPVPTAGAAGRVVTTLVSAQPAALDVLDASDQVFVADRSGLIWTLDQGQPTLSRPFTVAGTPVGLAADPASGRLYVAVRGQLAGIVVLDAASGQQLGFAALPSEPADVRLDSDLGLLFVVLPANDSLAAVDVRGLRVVHATAGLAQVTGMALDQSAHLLYLSQLGGQVAVVDCQSGDLVDQLTLTAEGLTGIAMADGRLFAVNGPGKALIEVDLATSRVSHLSLTAEPESVVVGPQSGAVYVLDRATNAVVKLDPGDGAELGRVAVGEAIDLAAPQLQPEALWLRPRMVVGGSNERVYVIEPHAASLAVAWLGQ
jgi:outer membrane protein assembly factor BamB